MGKRIVLFFVALIFGLVAQPEYGVAQEGSIVQAIPTVAQPCFAPSGKGRRMKCEVSAECWNGGGSCALVSVQDNVQSKPEDGPSGKLQPKECVCQQRVNCGTIKDKQTCRASVCGATSPGRCQWTTEGTCQCSSAWLKLPVDNS